MGGRLAVSTGWFYEPVGMSLMLINLITIGKPCDKLTNLLSMKN